MKQKFILFLILIFHLSNIQESNSQEFNLKITSKNPIETQVLKGINYTKKHPSFLSIKSEVEKIALYLKKIGYYTQTFDSLIKKNRNYTAYFSLNRKINEAVIKIKEKQIQFIDEKIINKDSLHIPIEKLKEFLSSVSKNLDNIGRSFSSVNLKNIVIKNNELHARLEIESSNKRIINNIIVKGYKDFPKSFLKNYYDLKDNNTFKQERLKEISSLSKNLPFVKEIKPPEVLFTKDSTLIYMYLEKKQNNSFDGIVNFATQDNGDLLFMGNLDLQINNIFNNGERFNIFWNSIGNERQEFRIKSEIPYVFNSKLSPEISFAIYRQDSTFLNTKFDSKIHYQINQKAKLALTINSENSKDLIEISGNNNVNSFENYFLGFQFTYSKSKNDIFLNEQISLKINPEFGQRKSNQTTTTQFKINAITSHLWQLNNRNQFYIKNNTGYLGSESLFENELFRIGGANSIRGFNEQSIFTNNYTYFNLEYRYLTSIKSYLYTISDFGRFNYNNQNNSLLSFGIGYLFLNQNSKININTSIGKINSNQFDFNNLQLAVSWINYF